jgi:L-amino acid N-acyltransferase YncA
MTDIAIAPTTPADLPLILDRAHSTFKTHQRTNPRAFPDGLFRKIEKAHTKGTAPDAATHASFVAEQAGRFVGHVLIKSLGPAGMIYDIGVIDSGQNKGVGTALLRQARAHALAQGWDVLIAIVWDGNDASHRLFQKAGFAANKRPFGKIARHFPKQRNTTYRLRLCSE